MTRRLATALLLLLLTVRLCGAAISAGAVWEVQTSSGSNLNGAGFDSSIGTCGTDQTYPTATVTSFTDLAATSGSTTVTSAIGGFTGMRCNALRINNTGTGAHCPLGWYFITVVTDNNTATLDRTPTTGGNCVAGQGKIGGATASLTGQTTAALQDQLIAGNTVYVKSEASWNEALVTAGGSAGTPITFECYLSTRGDAPTGANTCRNNRAAAGAAAWTPGADTLIKYFWMSNAGTSGFSLTSTLIDLIGCRSSNNTTSGVVASNGATMIGLEAFSNTTTGVTVTGGAAVYIVGSYIHDNTTFGINISSTHPTVINSLITGNASAGISVTTGRPLLYGNTIHSNTGASSDGVIVTTPSAGGVIMNNTLTSNGRYGANATSGASVWADYNNYSGNSTAARNGGIVIGTHDKAVAPAYTNTGAGNYAIGAALRAVAFPATIANSGSTSHVDIGAVQSGIGAATQRATGCIQ